MLNEGWVLDNTNTVVKSNYFYLNQAIFNFQIFQRNRSKSAISEWIFKNKASLDS